MRSIAGCFLISIWTDDAELTGGFVDAILLSRVFVEFSFPTGSCARSTCA